MRLGDKQLGAPQILYKNTKSAIQAMTVESGAVAYATDTNELGYYDGTSWKWTKFDAASTFLGLTDTPSSYSGQGGKVVSVKSDVSGLEFTTPLTGSGTSGRIARFSGANTIADSVMTETSDGVQIDTGKTLVLHTYGLDWTGPLAKYPRFAIRDHFTTDSISSYWTGWSITPSYYNYHKHFLAPLVSAENVKYYLYKNQIVNNNASQIEAWVGTDLNNTTAGLRFDNGYIGSSQEYSIELYLKSTNAIDGVAIYMRRNAYGTITEERVSNYFSPSKAFVLTLNRAGNMCFAYGVDEAGIYVAALGGMSVDASVTFVRHGLFIYSPNSGRISLFHFYATNF